MTEHFLDTELNYLSGHTWECYDHLALLDDAKAHFKRKHGREPERVVEQYRKNGTLRYLYLGPVNGEVK